MLEDLLLNITKPGRYIGQEWNAVPKDFDKASVRFALCFPDLYELGMSNLGIRILYGILNNIEDTACERFFSPAWDMEAKLRENRMSLFSLESRKPLSEFDIAGFSLAYELTYTNALNMLDLSGIPFYSSKRDNRFPLIIAGGPCAFNPEPMADFFDLFVIGEAEEAIVEVLDTYRGLKDRFKSGLVSKEDLLVKLSVIEGIYVPSLYEPIYADSGALVEFRPKIPGAAVKVKKRYVKDLDNAYFPVDWITPYIQIVHDRITLEIMRGCPNRCRFCQARAQYFPFRQRSINKIIDLACKTYERTGYEELSVTGLSVSDYPRIEELVGSLITIFKEKAVGVSLPSLKLKAIISNLSLLISTVKKTGLTFAPEVASEKLRKIIGKDFDKEEFFCVLEQAYKIGYRRVKLYFMLGLPYEEEEDLDAIIELANYASDLRKKTGASPAEVSISINSLIPKPHTPFQWFKALDLQAIRDKQNYLRHRLNNRRVSLHFHNPKMSILESALCRGDRKLGGVILSAFKNGARFDAWDEQLRFEAWLEAFKENSIDLDFYLREISEHALLAWDFIDSGISKEALLKEFNKIIAPE